MASRGSIGPVGAMVLAVWLGGAAVAQAQQAQLGQEPQEPQEPQGLAEPGAEPTETPGVAGSPLGAPALPLAWAERPLTLTGQTIRADGAFALTRAAVVRTDTSTGFPVPGHETYLALHLGAGYGITDDIEVGAEVLPLLLSPSVVYDDPSLYALFRFVSGFADLGATVGVRFPVEGVLTFLPGIPVRLHLSPSVRLDTGALLEIAIADRVDADNVPILTPRVPVELSVSATPQIFLGAGTGWLFPDVTEHMRPLQSLSVFAGYTVPTDAGPLADLRVRFGFPQLLHYSPGEGDVVVADVWELVLQANVYFNH